jgi:hypothetical protein
MEAEDFIRAKDMQIASLCEELHRERMNSERLEAEIANLYHAAQKSTRENLDLRKRLQAYIDACASIVRAECEADELRAEVAMLQAQARIIAEERDDARDTVLKLRRERAAQDAVIATYRDEACRESCRDKAAADGGWANI